MTKSFSRNTRKRCEICSKLTIETPKRHMQSVHLFLVGGVTKNLVTSKKWDGVKVETKKSIFRGGVTKTNI